MIRPQINYDKSGGDSWGNINQLRFPGGDCFHVSPRGKSTLLVIGGDTPQNSENLVSKDWYPRIHQNWGFSKKSWLNILDSSIILVLGALMRDFSWRFGAVVDTCHFLHYVNVQFVPSPGSKQLGLNDLCSVDVAATCCFRPWGDFQ